ncbi:MAG TPA: hypothetical protein VGK51_09940 [Actinomycetota bacterium]
MIQGVAIVLLAVLVAGLLRSHARILTALYQQGTPAGGAAGIPQPVQISKRPLPVATDIVGVTPDDETVSISVGAGVDTLLGFLSGGCSVCGELWAGAPAGESALPDRTRLVVVTASPDRESPSRVRRLAGPGVTVVMSTDTWEDYRVPAAPYFVLVDGNGRIAGEGSARSWDQVASLMGTASDDAEAARQASKGPREDRVDDELAAAGILPGDPRLYHPTIANPDVTRTLEGRLGGPGGTERH